MTYFHHVHPLQLPLKELQLPEPQVLQLLRPRQLKQQRQLLQEVLRKNHSYFRAFKSIIFIKFKHLDGNPNPDPVICNDPVVEPEYNEYGEKLIFSDEFDTMDFKKWKHDMTMSGGGNWEFQLYHNNRTNSFVKDGVFHIKPTLTEDRIGLANLKSNYRMDMWGGSPADECTGNNFYGCERQSGAGGNILNPIQSAKITTATTFNFKFGRVEIVAKLPKGDWLWPAIWMLPARNEYGMWVSIFDEKRNFLLN